MVCPSLRLLRNEQQSNSCRLMICALGAETGIKVVRGRQGQGGLVVKLGHCHCWEGVVTLAHCGHRVIDWV